MPEEVTETVEEVPAETQTETANPETEEASQQPTATDDGDSSEESTLLGEKKEEEAAEEVESEVPEKYEFNLPEGIELDNDLMGQVEPVLKEIGLSQEKAQKLVDVYAPYIQQKTEAMKTEAMNAYKEQVKGWEAETVKELGAEKDKQMALAAKALNKFGSDELRQVLNDTGLGNHPEFVRAFIKVGKAISEDSFVEPNQKRTDDGGFDARKLYPSMKQ